MDVYGVDVAESESYSTSYSGSETSTDISTSSLENLSTSARQDPQGEETTDLTPGLLDAGGESSSLSSVCDDDSDAKRLSIATNNDNWVTTTSAQQQLPQHLLTSSAYYRPVVSASASNSLIRQLLQTSPQYCHLLSDLEPMCAGPSPGPPEGKSTGSPKSTLRSGGRMDGRSLPETPATSAAMLSPRSGLLTYSTSQSAAINRRVVNRYVNVDEDASGRRGHRDRVRPSTAPSEHPPPSTAASLPVTRVQTVADPVERHRSFEVIDRVTGATLPRLNSQRKPSTVKRTSPPQHRDSHTQRTSPQHFQRSSPSQQQQQQQQTVNGSSVQSQQQEQHQTPPMTSSSSSSSLCVEQPCSTGDNQRSSPQTVWYVM